jgi:hypothetical protein
VRGFDYQRCDLLTRLNINLHIVLGSDSLKMIAYAFFSVVLIVKSQDTQMRRLLPNRSWDPATTTAAAAEVLLKFYSSSNLFQLRQGRDVPVLH